MLVPMLLFALQQQALPVVEIPNRPACPSCRLSLRLVTRLGDDEGPGALPSRPYSILRSEAGEYYVAMPETPDQTPLVFGANGAFKRTVGRVGDGPGEIRETSALELLGDTLVVFDGQLRRMSFFTSSGQYMRSAPIPARSYAAVRLKGDRFVMNGRVADAGRIGLPYHLFDRVGNSLGSRGVDTLRIDPRNNTADILTLWPSSDGGWFGLPMHHVYAIERWSAGGTHVQTFRRRPSWFLPSSDAWNKSDKRPPMPRGVGLWQSGDRLWVVLQIGAERWAEGLGRPLRMEGQELWPTADAQKLYRTVIEQIDMRTGRLISSSQLPGTIDVVIAPWLVGAIRERESGTLYVEVWEVRPATRSKE